MCEVRDAGLIVVEWIWNLTTLSLTVISLFGQFKQRPLDSSEKDVKKLSKINQELFKRQLYSVQNCNQVEVE